MELKSKDSVPVWIEFKDVNDKRVPWDVIKSPSTSQVKSRISKKSEKL